MIGINKLTVSTTAAIGTVVGGLTLFNASMVAMNANFILTDDAAGFFGLSGNNIVTMNTPIPVGSYSINVSAVGTKTYWSDEASFTITVTAT
jgi:hypothetical protein